MTKGFESTHKVELKHSTYEALRDMKKRGDTFDDVVKRLVESVNEVRDTPFLADLLSDNYPD